MIGRRGRKTEIVCAVGSHVVPCRLRSDTCPVMNAIGWVRTPGSWRRHAVNRTPSAARPSRLGVCTCAVPRNKPSRADVFAHEQRMFGRCTRSAPAVSVLATRSLRKSHAAPNTTPAKRFSLQVTIGNLLLCSNSWQADMSSALAGRAVPAAWITRHHLLVCLASTRISAGGGAAARARKSCRPAEVGTGPTTVSEIAPSTARQARANGRMAISRNG